MSDSDKPAFPQHPGIQCDGPPTDWHGMTLRDWFAGQALQGTATQEHDSGLSDVKPGRPNHPELAAKAAYRFADAMLEARKAKP